MRCNARMMTVVAGVQFRVGMSLALGLIATNAARADLPLFPGTLYATGDAPTAIAVGDLNGDQLPDLVVANSLSDNVSVLLGVGGGTFAAAVHYAAGDEPVSIVIGDVNGDQVPDLVVANSLSHDVSVLLGVGDGTFAAAMHYAVLGNDPESLAIGDLNGDLVLDLAVAHTSFRVSVLLGVGDGTFPSAVSFVVGGYPRSIAIGDLDGDLVPDLAVAKTEDVSVLLGIGDGTFATPLQYPAGDSPGFVAIDDLNGDLVLDLAVANSPGNNVSVLLGIGDGTFAAATYYAVGDDPRSVAIVDLDGDLVLDLAVVNFNSSNVSVLLGVGDGSFGTAAHYAAGNEPGSMTIGDLDNDQVPDVALASVTRDSVSVLMGVGDGTLAAVAHYIAGWEPTFVAIGDLNGDGVGDLAVANYDSDDVSILLAVGDGTFAAAVNYDIYSNPKAVAIGDLDGDQVPDLAVTGGIFGDGYVRVLLGVGDGTFTPGGSVNVGDPSFPVSVAISDLNGDLVSDLVVADRGFDIVTVALGNDVGEGDVDFQDPVQYAVGHLPESVAIADLNGDEVPDLVVANKIQTTSVLLGVGDGTFAASVEYVGGGNSVAIGDLNGDGIRDIARTSDQSGDFDVGVLLGVGNGTFVHTGSYATGEHATSVAIGDLDGDQIPDLAVTNRGSYPDYLDGDVSVLVGVGDGTFAAAVQFDVGDFPVSVAIGDVDGDHVSDLVVVAHWQGADVAVLLNNTIGCSGNDLPDACDVDCGPPGGPCDLPGCGLSEDCNGNGVADACDISDGISQDFDGNGTPDECYLLALTVGARYLAAQPPAGVDAVALKLTSPSLPCLLKYVDGEGNPVDSPVFQTPDAWGLVFVHGEGIVPGEQYEIRTETTDGTLSDPVASTTWIWGDANNDGIANLADVQLIVLGFQGDFSNATLYAVDLEPCTPNGAVNLADAFAAVLAFQGVSYTDLGCPVPCQ